MKHTTLGLLAATVLLAVAPAVAQTSTPSGPAVAAPLAATAPAAPPAPNPPSGVAPTPEPATTPASGSSPPSPPASSAEQAPPATAAPAPATVSSTPNAPAPAPTIPPALATVPQGTLTPVVGRHVRDAEGNDVGRIWDVLIDSKGEPRAAVIDYGGVLGIGKRKVAVAWPALKFGMNSSNDDVTLALTREQMGAIPDYQYAAGDATVGTVGSSR